MAFHFPHSKQNNGVVQCNSGNNNSSSHTQQNVISNNNQSQINGSFPSSSVQPQRQPNPSSYYRNSTTSMSYNNYGWNKMIHIPQPQNNTNNMPSTSSQTRPNQNSSNHRNGNDHQQQQQQQQEGYPLNKHEQKMSNSGNGGNGGKYNQCSNNNKPFDELVLETGYNTNYDIETLKCIQSGYRVLSVIYNSKMKWSKLLRKTMQILALEHDEIKVIAIDYTKLPLLSASLNIGIRPTIILYQPYSSNKMGDSRLQGLEWLMGDDAIHFDANMVEEKLYENAFITNMHIMPQIKPFGARESSLLNDDDNNMVNNNDDDNNSDIEIMID